MRSTRLVAVALAAVAVAGLLAPPLGSAVTTGSAPSAPGPNPADRLRAAVPADRYELAGGCYELVSTVTSATVSRSEGRSMRAGPEASEPFHLHATRLGEYLLFGTEGDFLGEPPMVAAPLLGAVSALTGGAVSVEGTEVALVGGPSERAEWRVEAVGARPDAFTLTQRASGRRLVARPDGSLGLADQPAPGADHFSFRLTDGCAEWPEITVNVTGRPAGGGSPTDEVRGLLEGHMHGMAFEFLGGRVHCGRPWHPYGVAHALRDCPENVLTGGRSVLATVLAGQDPVAGYDPVGWPTFRDWPAYDMLIHEGMYHRWLERAWRGGLRLFVNLFVDNTALCQIYPLKRNSCNEMDGVRLQAQRLHEMEDYIDAQSGGPGEGWFRIVTDPFEARRVINDGKLAVVMGIEVSVLFDCGEWLDTPQCTTADIDRRLAEVHDMGVRQMEIINKFDNALAGVTGDTGATGAIVAGGNVLTTGHFWGMETCRNPVDERGLREVDKTQLNLVDDGLGVVLPDASVRDALAGRLLGTYADLTGGLLGPIYPPGPHCNVRGLTALGEHLLRAMVQRGMLFDPDHMSAAAQREALAVMADEGYSGVISSHSWATEATVPRIYELGGLVTPYAGDADGFVRSWEWHKRWYEAVGNDPDQFAIGYGADMNGLGGQGRPRRPAADTDVEYPFTGPLGDVTIHRQTSGQRVYDVNVDGVAHYGLYPDWVRDVQVLAGDRAGELVDDLLRGPEAYLQMWERAAGVPQRGCISAQDSLALDDLHALVGNDAAEVLLTLGQPSRRADSRLDYCVERPDGSRAVLSAAVDGAGRVAALDLPDAAQGAAGTAPNEPAAPVRPPEPLEARGGAHEHGEALAADLAVDHGHDGGLDPLATVIAVWLLLMLTRAWTRRRPR